MEEQTTVTKSEVMGAIQSAGASERQRREVKVDMWDQEVGTEGTVSNAVRRYTAQWGMPKNLHNNDR